jgi:hypothetical protein
MLYIAKLYFGPNNDYETEDAVHEAIHDALDIGAIEKNFGRFWVVDGHILIDKEGFELCFHPTIEKCGLPGETQFCPDCEEHIGWEEL